MSTNIHIHFHTGEDVSKNSNSRMYREEPVVCPHCNKYLMDAVRRNGSVVSIKCKRCGNIVMIKI